VYLTIRPSENDEERSNEEEEQESEDEENLEPGILPISESSEELSLKPEDLILGPLPEEEIDIEERTRKLEAAQKVDEVKKAEDARRAEALRKEEELARKIEEKRQLEEKRKKEELARKAEEKRQLEEKKKKEEAEKLKVEALRKKEEMARKAEEEKRQLEAKRKKEEAEKLKAVKPPVKPSAVPESGNLLLQGLVNLLQPALDIKMESKKYQRWIKGWDKAIEVHILNEGYVHVLIKDGSMKAAIGKALQEPAVVMEGEYETITNYLNGELDLILMFFDFVLLRKVKLIKGLDIKLPNILSGNIIQQARDLYRIDKILKIK
jgi:chemotaxis protein histidine kinase CheA